MNATKDIVPNWLVGSPHPQISIGWKCIPFKVEFVVRRYLYGSMWRSYMKGQRQFWGITLPDGMREGQKLPNVMVTPSTKADLGMHDEDITAEAIVAEGLMTQAEYDMVADYSLKLFARGSDMAAEKGLLLVDTKYEFGKKDDEIMLIDEVHTPDSSRYFYADSYEENFANGTPQRELSKEFVRKWLMDNGFNGTAGQIMPTFPNDFIADVSNRYIELYEILTGEKFSAQPLPDTEEEIRHMVTEALRNF